MPEDFVVSPFSNKIAVSHPIFTAIDSDEDSDEAQDTINVNLDPPSNETEPPRRTRARTPAP